MHKGEIVCECGQEFYYETIRNFINCISCGNEYEVKESIIYAIETEPDKEGD